MIQAPPQPAAHHFAALVELLARGDVVTLTGAGISTESGIPDYRGPETRRRARNPVQYKAFVSDGEARRRYWARAVVGWPRFSTARPNGGHRALAALEGTGVVSGVVTQNVDRLHQAAGSRRVLELHGCLHDVRCLDCGRREPRDAVQTRLETLNPGWSTQVAEVAPDGDAELPPEVVRGFTVVGCVKCGGTLKPDVVFFGESVPKPTVADAFAMVEAARALLVIGSSLTVYSGYRFVRRAKQLGIPVAILTIGPTRGDADADLKLEARTGDVLPRLLEALAERATGRPASSR